MKTDHIGLMILALGEVGLGSWALLTLLDVGNLVDVLRLLSLC